MSHRLLLLLLIPLPLIASCQKKSDAPPLEIVSEAASNENTEGGMRAARKIYLDPVTGKVTSTPPAKKTAFNSQLTPNAKPEITQTVAADGTVSFHYEGGFKKNLRATIDCNGTILKSHSIALPTRACTQELTE